MLKSIRRLLGQAPRRGESRAWRSLKKPCGFKSQMFIQDLPQAGWPRTSSVVPLSQNLKGESWYSNNRGVRRSARLALLRIGSGALKLPRLCGPACWPARRQPRWIAAMSAAILPSLPTRPSRTPDAAYNCTNRQLHRLRESLIRDRTKTVNQMHDFLLVFGISLPQGLAVMKRLSAVLAEHELPSADGVCVRTGHRCDHPVPGRRTSRRAQGLRPRGIRA